VGGFYAPYDAQEIFEQFQPGELGVSPLKLDATFFCQVCEATASARTCPHDASKRLELSGTRVREILRSGLKLPPGFTRPEIAEILSHHYGGNGNGNGNGHGKRAEARTPRARVPRRYRASANGEQRACGFILWFTGLSGAGKSTLAAALSEHLEKEGPVEILDGDEVRTYLSAELGFSKEDRDTNIRRIGYVARVLARNGVAAIAAAISPYSTTRQEVRRLAAHEGIPFVEIFAEAELEALVLRDVKGLYQKALAGEIPHFTGISDPYEPPQSPDVRVWTDKESVPQSVSSILAALRERGLFDASRSVSEAVGP
jgi:adenylylsulfate kinase